MDPATSFHLLLKERADKESIHKIPSKTLLMFVLLKL